MAMCDIYTDDGIACLVFASNAVNKESRSAYIFRVTVNSLKVRLSKSLSGKQPPRIKSFEETKADHFDRIRNNFKLTYINADIEGSESFFDKS